MEAWLEREGLCYGCTVQDSRFRGLCSHRLGQSVRTHITRRDTRKYSSAAEHKLGLTELCDSWSPM